MLMCSFIFSALSDDGVDIRSVVDVIPDHPSCVLTHETELLRNYLITKEPVAQQSIATRYRFYSPPDLLGPSYGIYTAEHTDPVTAKQQALGHCKAGEAIIVSDTLIVDDNVAVKFNC